MVFSRNAHKMAFVRNLRRKQISRMMSSERLPEMAKPFSAFFRGFEEPGETYPLTDIVYQTKSGGLLEVQHDMEALAQVSATQWKELFDRRTRSNTHPFSSGVWKFKEWVLPHVPDEKVLTLGEGNSQLTPLPRYAKQIGLEHVWIKQCGVSHSGSFKDLGMTALLSHVNSQWDKGVIKAVGCASSGDTSAAVAAYSSYAGIPSIVFLPSGKVSLAQLVQPLANGSTVFALDTDFDGCMKAIKEVVARHPVYLANSMNPLRLEGQKTVAMEITQQMNWEVPDFVVIPSGNLGNVYAFYKGFKMMKELGLIDRIPVMVAAQAEQANPLYLAEKDGYPAVNKGFKPVAAKPTQASAIQIGNPVSYPRAVMALKETGGFVEQASEEELMDATAFGDRCGLFSCPHTGVGLACLQKAVANGRIGKSDRVVVVSTAHGLKFADAKVNYHKQEIANMECKYANKIEYLPPDAEMIINKIKERNI